MCSVYIWEFIGFRWKAEGLGFIGYESGMNVRRQRVEGVDFGVGGLRCEGWELKTWAVSHSRDHGWGLRFAVGD